jgi:hypothetical protein
MPSQPWGTYQKAGPGTTLPAGQNGSRTPMQDALLKSLVKWCEEQRATFERQLALMEDKTMWTGELRDGRYVNTTAESIERVRGLLAEVDKLLAEYGSAERPKKGNLQDEK